MITLTDEPFPFWCDQPVVCYCEMRKILQSYPPPPPPPRDRSQNRAVIRWESNRFIMLGLNLLMLNPVYEEV